MGREGKGGLGEGRGLWGDIESVEGVHYAFFCTQQRKHCFIVDGDMLLLPLSLIL